MKRWRCCWGAVTYLLLAVVLGLAVWLTLASLDLGAFTNVKLNNASVERLDVIATPTAPDYAVGKGWAPEGLWEAAPSAAIASWIMSGWLWLLWLLLPAYIVSYYFSSQTWVYLLLRKAADGMEYDDMYVEDEPIGGGGGLASTAPPAPPATAPPPTQGEGDVSPAAAEREGSVTTTPAPPAA